MCCEMITSYLYDENSCTYRRRCNWPGFVPFVIGDLQPSESISHSEPPPAAASLVKHETLRTAAGTDHGCRARWQENCGVLDQTRKSLSDPIWPTRLIVLGYYLSHHCNLPPLHPQSKWFDWQKLLFACCAWGIYFQTVNSALIHHKEKRIGQNFITPRE